MSSPLALKQPTVKSTMNRSVFWVLLLGLQLSDCMSINQTNTESIVVNNSSIYTEKWDSTVIPLVYSWIGEVTNLLRKTGELATEIFGDSGPTAFGNQVRQRQVIEGL